MLKLTVLTLSQNAENHVPIGVSGLQPIFLKSVLTLSRRPHSCPHFCHRGFLGLEVHK